MSLSINGPFRFFVIALAFLAFSSYGFTATTTPSQEQMMAEKEIEAKEKPEKFFDPDMKELSGRAFVTSDGVLLSGSFTYRLTT